MKPAKKTAVKLPTLPQGVTLDDLKYPAFEPKSKDPHLYALDFELWYTEGMGWVLPTLAIRNQGSRSLAVRGAMAPRTYAVQVTNGKQCRVGLGPHVEHRVTVYVRKSSEARMKWLCDLKHDGEVASNEIRDRISTRRAIGSQMRAEGRSSWLW